MRKRRERGPQADAAAAPPALELAAQFIDDLHVDASAEEREAIEWMVLCAGQYVAEEAGPGRWDALDGAELLRRMPADSEQEHTALCLYLVGFVGWMAVVGYLDPARAAAVAAGVRTCTDDPSVVQLCDRTIELVGRPPPETGEGHLN